METLTIEYDSQNEAIRQLLDDLLASGVFRLKDNEDDEFTHDLERAISGDELINRLSVRIFKMFENEGAISAGAQYF
ncbi:MAG: hypothetical protein LBE56_07030 [Tannerella sp.]|jgi:hypothetical protein|nr:hypothetical protein [Tannerella sp.]